MTFNKKNIKNNVLLIGIVFCILILLCVEIWRKNIFGTGINADIIYSLSTRTIGAFLCILLIFYCSYQNILKIKFSSLPKAFIFTIPCWAIAVNNFPIISYFSGNSYISASITDIMFYFIQCLCVGLFEEMAFRGCIFMMVLQKRRKTVKDLFWSIVISSVIFGLIHIVNIFAGASPASVILQIGYSFLIGGMCSVVLMKTGCIWHCVFIHAVYNFCGGIVPEFGGGKIWDVPTIVLTIIISIIVAAYVILSLFRIDTEKVGNIFFNEEKTAISKGVSNADI